MLVVQEILIERMKMGFPGGSVLKNLATKSGNVSSIPDLGRSHEPWSNEVHEPQQLSLCVLEPVLHNKRSLCSEKRMHHD